MPMIQPTSPQVFWRVGQSGAAREEHVEPKWKEVHRRRPTKTTKLPQDALRQQVFDDFKGRLDAIPGLGRLQIIYI